MTRFLLGIVAFCLVTLPLTPMSAAPTALTYDIVYVRQPRRGDAENVKWPEVFHPVALEPGSDLMLLHPNGSEEVLVAGGNGAVTDPFVSFDGQWVYYAYAPDMRVENLNYQRDYLPKAGADIYRINLTSRQIQRLTHQEFTPHTGAGNFKLDDPVNAPDPNNRLGYGIVNLGPTPIAGGKVMFTSNRAGLVPPKGYTSPSMQLYVMDEDGANVTPIAPMSHSSALHPTPLADGRVMFSTHEGQAMRDQRMWGVWSILPDGRYFEPQMSAFRFADALHFFTQMGNGDIVVADYYNLNNMGFGALYRFPVGREGQVKFNPAPLAQNPPITTTLGGGQAYPLRFPFTPKGLVPLTPFTTGGDDAAPQANPSDPNSPRVGKFTHPSAAPNDDLLVAYSAGPVNLLNRPTTIPAVDSGIYIMPGGRPLSGPAGLIKIKNEPNYNEAWPRAVVPYRAVHGIDTPAKMPWLPNDGSVHAQLPAGTAFGLVGTSSFYKRESFPGFASDMSFDGLEQFNTSTNEHNSNWFWQGADAGKYANSDIWAVRMLAMEPNTHRSYGPNEGQQFFNYGNERLRILGEIPLRKFDAGGQPVLDSEGNPDTSFLAKLPADTPFTFQTIDRNGMVLNMAQTWHQVRPGEMRADCGGCHAHSQQPLAFEATAAAKPGYSIPDLSKFTPLVSQDATGKPTLRTVASSTVNVEFTRDIRPLLARSCTSCHTKTDPNAPGKLVLDDLTPVRIPGTYTDVPGDYARLCADQEGKFGLPSLIELSGKRVWRGGNASRYVIPYQSRRSLLTWKIFGQRTDGWTNADHPTESVPGDLGTLPAGADKNDADLDFTGTIMPPATSNVPALTIDEKMTFARWIDLGCPIDHSAGTPSQAYGWLLDDMPPALTLSAPRPGLNTLPLTTFRVGVADGYTGIATGTLSITSTLGISGRAPGTQLADLAVLVGDGIYELVLPQMITHTNGAHVVASVRDGQGNITRVDQSFSIGAIQMNARTYLPITRR